ncbi:trehalose phosphatase, partial [Pseudomonas aeruginosa]|nr:trehalose phosphatase [Pseudomonas aeruginosa]
MGTNRPLVFVDLDDTLFQTSRKMVEGTPRTTATLAVYVQ